MPQSPIPDRAQPCIWMSAGLLTYKLCDRDFDCDRCPMDAALRGASAGSPQHEALLAPSRDARVFPDDRLYTTGHCWVRAIGGRDDRLLRFGLDAFAAAIIGRCLAVSWHPSQRTLARRETLCQIDLGLGMLRVGAPLRSVVVNGNETLQEQPGQLVTAPYGDGWIADLIAIDLAELDGLLTAEPAREKARLDMQRFRRRAALQLLVDAEKVGRSAADGGELLTDLRQILGGPNYLELLRDLIQ